VLAQLDDRDGADVLGRLEWPDHTADDDALLAWLEQEGEPAGAGPVLRDRGQLLPVQRVTRSALGPRYGFVPRPAP
jgi:hypothetical protein